MILLSKRQEEILKSIIQSYIEDAQPVGSNTLVEKYNLDVSPATIRNEMAQLSDEGFLEKPHASAGRVPTPLAFRYFIKNLMQEKEIPAVSEVAIKERLWKNRHRLEPMLRSAVQALAEETQNLSIALVEGIGLHHAGMAYILRHPEFYDIELARTVLHLLDQDSMVSSILNQIPQDQEFGVLLSEEMGLESLAPCGIVFGRIDLPGGRRGFLGVLGPIRLNYPRIIPTVRYFRSLIDQLGRGL